jgi:hypothetical protein
LSGCPVGVTLLYKFHTCIKELLQDIGKANKHHPLAVFVGDPTGCIRVYGDADALSPYYMRARGLRAVRVCEVEHFWAGSVGKGIA